MANIMGQSGQSKGQQSTASNGGSGRFAVYIVAIVAVIVIIGVIYFLYSNYSSPTGTSIATTTLQQSNAAPIYMSASDAQELMGSPINYSSPYNYSTSNLFNMSAPENITILEYLTPALAGNVTNGWFTIAFGSSSNNATIQYFVLQTNNASNMSTLLAEGVSSTFPALPNIVHGSLNGMNYTYETYSNSTGSTQALVGYKGGYIGFAYIEANNFTTNQATIAQVVSSNI